MHSQIKKKHKRTPKYPEHSPVNLFSSLLTITYRCLPSCQKHLEKPTL